MSQIRSKMVSELVRDAVILVTGIVLVTSTLWLEVDGDRGILAAMLILGMLSAGTALWAMASASRPSHWTHVVLGVALAISPAILAFPSDLRTADILALVGGVIIAIAGLLGVFADTADRGARSGFDGEIRRADRLTSPFVCIDSALPCSTAVRHEGSGRGFPAPRDDGWCFASHTV